MDIVPSRLRCVRRLAICTRKLYPHMQMVVKWGIGVCGAAA